MFRMFDDDPFFSMHRQHMQSMSDMMSGFGMPSMMAPSLMAPSLMAPSLMAPPGMQHDRVQQVARQGHRMQDPFANIMSDMQRSMGNMQSQMMSGSSSAGNGGQFYSSSTVMSYSNTGDGAPKVYQAHSSTRQAPGGIRETQKSVRDSASGLEKLEVGHHIHDRGHVIERSRNHRTGDQEENQNYINIEESEGDAFNREWQNRTQQFNQRRQPAIGGDSRRYRNHSNRPTAAITDGRTEARADRRNPEHSQRHPEEPSRYHHRGPRKTPYESSGRHKPEKQ